MGIVEYLANLSGDHEGPVVLVEFLLQQRLVSSGEPKLPLACCRFKVAKCEGNVLRLCRGLHSGCLGEKYDYPDEPKRKTPEEVG